MATGSQMKPPLLWGLAIDEVYRNIYRFKVMNIKLLSNRQYFDIIQGCINTTKIHFFIPPTTFENHFLSRLQHLVVAQWDTTFGGNCWIQHLVAAVGYKFSKKKQKK